MEISLCGSSLALLSPVGEPQVPPEVKKKTTTRKKQGGPSWVGPVAEEWRQLSSFWTQPPLDPTREAGRRLLPGPRELAVRFE